MVPKAVSDTRVAMGRLAIILTTAAWQAYVVTWFFADFFRPGHEGAVARSEEFLYLVIVTLLTVSALAYLLARLGFFYRTRTHHRAARAALDKYFDARRPALTTIIPSYQEDGRVIRTTLLSAALLGVNLAGTLSSIVQGITASKAPFARTPKVRDRTVVAPFLLIAPYILIGLAGYTLYHAYVNHLTENTFYAAMNVMLACYAVVAFIGLLTPAYQFQSTSANPARQSVLGFVVAASSSACTPSWGGAYTLAAAGQTLSMSARIAQLQQEGARAIVSFGGQANTSLDVACPTSAALAAAYQSVISAYSLTTIDLDIEGAALNNAAAKDRRAKATGCRTRPSGPTRESPRRPSRPMRPGRRGRRCTVSRASRAARPAWG
jgi:hypothetical protein